MPQLGIFTNITQKAIMGEMVFGLAVVWVHPYPACISTLDEVAEKLNLLTTSGKNWATPLCSSVKMPNMFPSLRRVTLAL